MQRSDHDVDGLYADERNNHATDAVDRAFEVLCISAASRIRRCASPTIFRMIREFVGGEQFASGLRPLPPSSQV
jgi:hypothetical protein